MKKNLLLVAHPDDECIFFAGLVLQKRKNPWHLICVTDGNADGRGHDRAKELAKSVKLLGVGSYEQWDFPDRFHTALDIGQVLERLRALPSFHAIYTHGPLGEYGHPHHQDLALAAARAFSKHPRLFGVAYNCAADQVVDLSAKNFAKKAEIYSTVYRKETQRFSHILPAQGVEAFARFDVGEVEALHAFFRRKKTLRRKHLKKYYWMRDLLRKMRSAIASRPF